MPISHLEILENLFFIQRGYLNANHFVYRGDPPILIDTGYIADFNTTCRLITDLGVDIKKVSSIITTHCHCDHIGGHNRIQKGSGCDIYVHEIGKIFIETRDDWATWWKYYHQKADFFQPTHVLNDREHIHIGPHDFEVIHTPGHAADGIVLYHHKKNILISSDTLWQYDMAVHNVRVEGSAAAYHTKKSLEKLAHLEPHLICPGHGAAFTDFRGALERSKNRINGYLLDRKKIGQDVLKKIIVYTLMMNKSIVADSFYDQLFGTNWYKETVDFYFNSNYRYKYDEIIGELLKKEIIKRDGEIFITTVKP